MDARVWDRYSVLFADADIVIVGRGWLTKKVTGTILGPGAYTFTIPADEYGEVMAQIADVITPQCGVAHIEEGHRLGLHQIIAGEMNLGHWVVSPYIGDELGVGSPWWQDISPYAWITNGAVLKSLIWAPVMFGHEVYMAHQIEGLEGTTMHNPAVIAERTGFFDEINDIKAGLYYRQIEDADIVAELCGKPSPSS